MKNILIVDDEKPIRDLLCLFLQDAGYHCSTAENVFQAKEILKSGSFDLLLSDINMPGESGVDLAQYVKEHYPSLPIIICSVIDSPDSAKNAFKLGVYGFIVKPFTRNIVLIGVENALRRNRLELESQAYQKGLETKVRQQDNTMRSQAIFLQNFVDAIPYAVFYLSRRGIVMGCNQVFEKFVAKKREKILGHNIEQLVPKNLADLFGDGDGQNIGHDNGDVEISVANGQGIQREILLRRTLGYGEEGLGGTAVVMLDITERQKMELALRTSEEKYRQIVDNIEVGVVLLNPKMEIVQMNPQMRDWFPAIEPAKGCVCYQSFRVPARDKPCRNCPVVKTFSEGISCEATVRIEGLQRDRFFRDLSYPLHDEQGRVTGAILLVEDVTEKLELDRELRQAQKLEAIGQLAAGIAHEINTPIQYVGSNVEFLQEAFAGLGDALAAHENLVSAVKNNSVSESMLGELSQKIDEADVHYFLEEVPPAIQETQEGVRRVTEIVRAMRDFSHPGSDQMSAVDLNQAIQSTVTVARNEWKYVAEMVFDLDPALPQVVCLPGEVNQVLLNIIVNGAHAIADVIGDDDKHKGTITIVTRQKEDQVIIRISDTGTGIATNAQHRIFDPFFTTKIVGKGTGQGLSLAHRVIAEKHGGKLYFETDSVKGTTFIIELPIEPVKRLMIHDA